MKFEKVIISVDDRPHFTVEWMRAESQSNSDQLQSLSEVETGVYCCLWTLHPGNIDPACRWRASPDLTRLMDTHRCTEWSVTVETVLVFSKTETRSWRWSGHGSVSHGTEPTEDDEFTPSWTDVSSSSTWNQSSGEEWTSDIWTLVNSLKSFHVSCYFWQTLSYSYLLIRILSHFHQDWRPLEELRSTTRSHQVILPPIKYWHWTGNLQKYRE